MNRHLLIGLQGTRLSTEETRMLRDFPPLGVILFARNCEAPEQVKALLDAVRQTTGKATWSVIDEEGGRVNRMPWPPFSERHAAADYLALSGGDVAIAEKAVYQDNLHTGGALVALGFTHNCAPVLDVFHADGHGIIGERAYAADVETVARLGAACMRGLHAAGIAAVGKHFPGHGRANADSHLALPQVDAPLATLLAEAQGFRQLIDQGLRHVMTAHVVYNTADNQREKKQAATFSTFWVQQVLRERFSFSGRVWSDDLCMQGAGGDVRKAADAALAAGCDVLLLCEPEAVVSILREDMLGSAA
ncbi:MAG: beta-N-acetylhexosaminidase [Mariprofundaceae bacterium]|nr:beta-N-acetylhexosaminidase [Mariprofundaceae bacterium]